MTDYRMIEVEETSYLYHERSCSMDPSDISQNMGIAFQTVLDFTAKNGITEVGKSLSVYYTHEEKTMTFQAGFIVPDDDAVKAKVEVKAGVAKDCPQGVGAPVFWYTCGPRQRMRVCD